MSDILSDDQVHDQLLRPPQTFKGVELWPWSRSARHLLRMISDPETDLFIFDALAMVWILKKRGGITAAEDIRKHVIPRIYADVLDVKAEIIIGRDELTGADEAEAMRIHEENMNAERATEVQVTSPGAQKKRLRRAK